MHFPAVFTGLGIMACVASARPYQTLSSRQARGAQNVVYWGQNGGGTVENNDLSTYCTSTSGIDIIVLAFLYEFGNGDNIPSGTIGQSCFISTSGEGQDCTNIQDSIPICQAAGIKVILSLGGASGSYSLQSDAEAETIGQYLWDAYANSGNTTVQRPFGNSFVNGFDFDIELNDGYSQYYPSMISTLRSNFPSDPDNTYYTTGAPQCSIVVRQPHSQVKISISIEGQSAAGTGRVALLTVAYYKVIKEAQQVAQCTRPPAPLNEPGRWIPQDSAPCWLHSIRRIPTVQYNKYQNFGTPQTDGCL